MLLEITDDFHRELPRPLQSLHSTNVVIIAGDFNAQYGYFVMLETKFLLQSTGLIMEVVISQFVVTTAASDDSLFFRKSALLCPHKIVHRLLTLPLATGGANKWRSGDRSGLHLWTQIIF